MKKLAFATAVALLAASSQAQLVTNGGFETGDLTGWTQFGDVSYTGVWDGDSHSGEYNAYFGPLSPGGIMQSIAANPGDQVTVSFWARSEGAWTPNSLMADLDGEIVANIMDMTHTDWAEYTATVTVTNANPVLRFTLTNPTDYLDIDSVSATLVPAPGALALLGAGGLVAVRRRRK
jgi:MYXO-CTERM domain-containing protein